MRAVAPDRALAAVPPAPALAPSAPARVSSAPALAPDAPGVLALLGGAEHRAPCAGIDRWLLERVGHGGARVVVIPAASSASGMPLTAALARNHWTALGARVTVVSPRAAPAARAHDALAAADIVVLTGGVPGRLVRALGASPLWERVLERWRAGAILAGSSAGAMALCTWRLALRAPHPLRPVPGLGPLDGHVCVPHFERFVRPLPTLHPWVRRVARDLPGAGIIGVDEATALVVDGARWHVLGNGAVTIVDGAGWRTVPAGHVVAPAHALAA